MTSYSDENTAKSRIPDTTFIDSTPTPREELRETQPNDIDLFSDEALNLADKLHTDLPNTWGVLYHKGLMPEILQFIHVHDLEVETRAKESEWETALLVLNPNTRALTYATHRLMQLKTKKERGGK